MLIKKFWNFEKITTIYKQQETWGDLKQREPNLSNK